MNIEGIREQLHHFIDTIEDKKAEAIYTLFEGEMDTAFARKQLVKEEREQYLKGEGKSFSWEDVKKMALNKDSRNAL